MIKPLKRILSVDLTTRKTNISNRPKLFAKYLGGAGVASRLLIEECPPNVDPFSPASPIIFATGPLVGLLPSMAKAVAMFKSPLTGNLGESHAGGFLATTLRFADYGAVVIKGASHSPISLFLDDEGMRFEDASHLWNRSPREVEESLIPSNSVRSQHSVASIGRAGETGVSYASVVVDRYHHFGRLGLGGVMGSKKLKAIVISTSNALDISPFEGTVAEAKRTVCNSEVMNRYAGLGTVENISQLNALGALPSRNFSRPRHEDSEALSGESFAQRLERKTSCPGCPITCVHLATNTNGSSHSDLVAYNYEPIFALGSNIDVSDPKGVLRLLGKCADLGMDAMMTGAVLAWATEAHEKGLIFRDQLMGVEPEWGNIEAYLDMIDGIASRSTRLYVMMGRGVSGLAQEYGGEDFAVSLGKNSPAGYLTGYAHLVGTLVGARHSHLSNAGYKIDQVAFSDNLDPETTVNLLVQEEGWLNVLNSLVACYFSRDVYSKDLILRSLSEIGVDYTEDRLVDLGMEISRNLYYFKKREGFDLLKERIPQRLLEVKGASGYLRLNVIQQMISKYVQLMESEDHHYLHETVEGACAPPNAL